MINVILDTNFLIYCAKNKRDYKEEIGNLLNEGFNLIVANQVIIELNKLKNDVYKKVSGKDKDACSLALQLLDTYHVERVDVIGKTVDEAIVNLALQDKKNVVATLDREMRHKLPRVILINRFKRLMLTK